ncbi:MAG: hypothetical protein JW782_07750 [Candidatus Saganbacteria bacterium]|nr:hypothetical protein [Candidatus Saganbacteria bacterium]
MFGGLAPRLKQRGELDIRRTDPSLSGAVGRENARQITSQRGQKASAGHPVSLVLILREAEYLTGAHAIVNGARNISRFYHACRGEGQSVFLNSLEQRDIRTLFDIIVRERDVAGNFAFLKDKHNGAADHVFSALDTTRRTALFNAFQRQGRADQVFDDLFSGLSHTNQQQLIIDVMTAEQRQAFLNELMTFKHQFAFLTLCDKRSRGQLYLSLSPEHRRVMLLTSMTDHQSLRDVFRCFHRDELPILIQDLAAIKSLGLLLVLFAQESINLRTLLLALRPADLEIMFTGLEEHILLDLFIFHMDRGRLSDLFERLDLDVNGFRIIYDNLSEGAKKIVVEALKGRPLAARYSSVIEPSEVIWAKVAPGPGPAQANTPLRQELVRLGDLGFIERQPRRTKEAMQLLGIESKDGWKKAFTRLLKIFRSALVDPNPPAEVMAAMKSLTMAREIMLDRVDTMVFTFKQPPRS